MNYCPNPELEPSEFERWWKQYLAKSGDVELLPLKELVPQKSPKPMTLPQQWPVMPRRVAFARLTFVLVVLTCILDFGKFQTLSRWYICSAGLKEGWYAFATWHAN